MRRYNFLWVFIFGLLIQQLNSQDNRDGPNFIIILADNLGYADLGITGSKQIKPPILTVWVKMRGSLPKAMCPLPYVPHRGQVY